MLASGMVSLRRSRPHASVMVRCFGTQLPDCKGNAGEYIWKFSGDTSEGEGFRAKFKCSDKKPQAIEIPPRKIMIMGGVHGNEALGVNVIKRLVKTLNKATLDPLHQVTLALGNPIAIEKNKRGSSEDRDLNREFIFERDPQDDYYEARRAEILKPFLEEADVLVDIHATNKPSEPFIRLAGHLDRRHFDISSWFIGLNDGEKTKVLMDNFNVLGGRICTTDEYAGMFGAAAICLETGQAGDLRNEDLVYERLLSMLKFYINLDPKEESTKDEEGHDLAEHIAMRSNRLQYDTKQLRHFETPTLGDPHNQDFFFDILDPYGMTSFKTSTEGPLCFPQVYENVFEMYTLSSQVLLSGGNKFKFEDTVNQNWAVVKTGQLIGGTIGEAPKEYFADASAVVLFPKIEELQKEGLPICYLATKTVRARPFKHAYMLTSKLLEANLENLEKVNLDRFISWANAKKPGLYRLSEKAKHSVLDPETPHVLDSLQAKPRKKLKKHTVSLDPLKPAASSVTDVLGAISSTVPLNITVKVLARQILHSPSGSDRSVVVYPTPTEVVGSNKLKCGLPLFSAGIMIPNKADHFFYAENAGETCIGAVVYGSEKDRFYENPFFKNGLSVYEVDPNKMYYGFQLVGDSFLDFDDFTEEDEHYRIVSVKGSAKSDVGQSFLRLSVVLHELAQLQRISLLETHPVFDQRGELIQSVNPQEYLSVSYFQDVPDLFRLDK